MRNVYFALALMLLAALLAIYLQPQENPASLPSVLSIDDNDGIVDKPNEVEQPALTTPRHESVSYKHLRAHET